MARRVKRNNEGVSLVEMLIAMSVLLVVALSMMQTALVGIDANMRNVLRDEGVSIAEKALDGLRNERFSDLSGLNGTTGVAPTGVRKATVDYTITNSVSTAGPRHRNVEVRVEWQWKGEIYNTTIATILENRSRK